MKVRTVGCIELNSVATGMLVTDAMLKAAEVTLLLARPTCPGRYLAFVAGDTAAVQASVDAGCSLGADMVVDWFTIPNVHEDVMPALNGTGAPVTINALGVIETCSSAACILAADAAAKASTVTLLEIRIASGLAGKAFVTMTGDVSAVEAAVRAGVAGVGNAGPVLTSVVIPAPSPDFKPFIL